MNGKGELLLKTLTDDVCEYIGIPLENFKDFCMSSTDSLSAEWNVRQPKSYKEITAYYRMKENWYIGDLAWWHTAVGGRKDWFYRNTRVMMDWGVETAMDYGCGIGTDGLVAAAHGIRVTLVDFDTPATDFAKWRCGKWGLEGMVEFLTFPEDEGKARKGVYDFIFLIDVLEHTPDHHDILRELNGHAWMFCISAPFKRPETLDPYHPQHLIENANVSYKDMMAEFGYHPFEGDLWVEERRWEEYADRMIEIEKGKSNDG